jgi:ATP-dependent DNA helicase RecQ
VDRSDLPPPALISPSASIEDPAILARFGVERLRDFQREAIEAVAEGGRVLLVAPTGGGKSLSYQLPAVVLGGTALVLSPLIALMEDQVRALAARGVPATFFASTLPREENARRLAALRRGAYTIVYAAPERLAQPGFVESLASIPLSLVAVDEAHCIVQWGHDFRPDYLKIGEALDRLRAPRAIACTATATPDARAEILARLGWDEAGTRVVLRGFARPNLHLAAREVSGPREAEHETAAALLDALGSPTHPEGAAIVYAATRRGAERVAGVLRERGWDAATYHAGLEPEHRARASAAFASRELPVVVATNAFGMGIDRPDVRLVVHVQPPASIDAYYQEVGRAGRDGRPARGLLFFSCADIALRRRLAARGEGGEPASPEMAARAWGAFRELLAYVDAATCRHDFILRHFGDEAESLGGCGHCDVCLDLAARGEVDPAAGEADLDAVRRALAGVARARGAAGLAAVAAMLAGERTSRVIRTGLDRLSTFGLLAGRGDGYAMGVLRVLCANGWVDLTDGEFPVPRITETGRRVMQGELQVHVRLPAPRPRRARGERRTGAQGAERRRSPVDEALDNGMDRALFEALRSRRAELARAKKIPPYVIAPDRTLVEIALVLPRCPEDLALVHGLGPARIAAYGDGLLAVVREHAPR